ncbi:monosaccharide ABC transporter substrate-binding protein, CUT2 family [Clostridium sp. USBA 49]|uniref:substrate-binding domain-containing protein n=1 Tax=Clostridium TaxID=1485 RepID=UPI0009CB6475|nr:MULTISPECIES: substrate-binding domain-containing protein [Clostridium]SKA72989.1 monosaccharide ABC transporter substrate-binding protein, CUT2 family [Clostridium sp. USBA 49]
MKNKIILIFILISIIISAAFYGFHIYKNKGESSIDRRVNIDFIVKINTDQYWNSVYLGAHEASKEFNVNMTFIAPSVEYDVSKQEELFLNSLEKNVDAIVLAASDYEGMKNLVQKAYEKKIPVITVDSGVNSDKVASKISTDNFKAGSIAAEKLIDAVGERGNIAIINFDKKSESAYKRESGVINVLKQHPEINLISKKYCYSNEKTAYNLTKDMLLNYDKLDGIITLNNSASLGAAQAIEELGLGEKIKLIAFDNTPLEIQYLEKGIIDLIVVQNPFKMGYLGIKNAAMAARGIDVDKELNIETRIIDKNNIYTKENQKFIFPITR